MNSVYVDFKDILPDIFSQVIVGIEEKIYSVQTGTIVVKLINGQGIYAPALRHSGSLEIVWIASQISQFLKTVPLQSFFKPQLKDNEKNLLENVFKQLIKGENELEHSFGDLNTVVKIEKLGEGYLKHSIHPKHPDAEKYLAYLTNFLETQNLASYFGVTNKGIYSITLKL
jgi:hypothetical protein